MKIDKRVIDELTTSCAAMRYAQFPDDTPAQVPLATLEAMLDALRPLVAEAVFGERLDTFGHVRRTHQAPERRDGGRHEAYTLHHPAFGVVEVTQWHGGGACRMFGSDLGHNTGIRLAFHEAHLVRSDLSSERAHAGPLLLEVELSLSGWSRLVSSIGNGSGIPVTIGYKRDGALLPCPQIAAPEASKKELHGEEMATALRERLEAITGHIGRLGSMIDQGKITKTELREIQRELARHAQQLPGSVQFVFDQFAEATEKVADDAKIEFEVHVDGLARKLGYESIRDMAPVLQLGAPKAEEG